MTQAVRRGVNVLDPAQLVRIEAVHRGYLFQHLYTVQCLLSAVTLSMESVEVESDEDVEVQLDGRRIYVQVKHRIEPLAWNDIEGAVMRFGALRAVHKSGERHGDPAFLIISNAAPNGPLAARLAAVDWPGDVRVDWPSADPEKRVLPAPQSTLVEAAEAASKMAGELPFATLAPGTLVWKLAGLVSLAATGEDENLDHTFRAGELPNLFEQLVMQLQDLPLPPSPYRVQEHEPDLWTGARVRPVTIRPTEADVAIARTVARVTRPAPERLARALTWGADEKVLLALTAVGWLASRGAGEPARRAANHAGGAPAPGFEHGRGVPRADRLCPRC